MTRRAATWLSIVLAVTLAGPSAAPAAIPPPVLEEDWQRVTSAHFDVLGNVDRKRLVEVARGLERLAETLELLQPSLAARGAERWRVYALDGEPTFKHYGLANVENLLGYCLTTPDDIRLVLNARDESAPPDPVTMYHEFTHAYFNANFQRVPLWLSEGLAQYYSTFVPGEQSAEIGRPIGPAAEWMQRHAPLPLETLFAVAYDSPQYRTGDTRQTFYAQSWALVAYLVSTAPRDSNAFERYLGRLWQGEEPTRAFEAVYPRATWPTLARDAVRYVTGGDYTYTRYTFKLPFDPARVEVAPVGRADRLADFGDLLLLHHDVDGTSVARAEEHYRAAADASPEHGWSRAGIGYTLDLQGRTATAESLYHAAYALTPDDPRTCLLAGRGALRRWERAPEASRPASALMAARNRYACVLAARPRHGEALIGYGRTYVLHTEPAPRAATNALALGFQSRPDRVDLLWDLLALAERAGQRAQSDSLMAVMRARLPERDLARFRERRGAQDAHASMQEGIQELNRENFDAALAAFRAASSTTDPQLRAEVGKLSSRADARRRLSIASTHLMSRRTAQGQAILDTLVTDLEASPGRAELSQELEHARRLRTDAAFQLLADQGVAHGRAGRVEAARAAFMKALEIAREDAQKEYVRKQLDQLKSRR